MLLNVDHIVKDINNKEEKGWKLFFNSFYEPLCNHALRVLHDDQVAADVVQETMIKLWDGNAVFENGKALTVYIYHAVTNNSLKYLRDRNVEDERLRQWSALEEELSEDDFSSVVLEEVLRELKNIIDNLPKDRRKIMLMSLEGMSGEEIAQALGVTIHTVKQQKYRAYKLIKERLGNHGLLVFFFFF